MIFSRVIEHNPSVRETFRNRSEGALRSIALPNRKNSLDRSQSRTKKHINSAADQAEGTVKDAAGKLTGDKGMQAEGTTDKAKGEAHKAVGDAKDATKDAVKR